MGCSVRFIIFIGVLLICSTLVLGAGEKRYVIEPPQVTGQNVESTPRIQQRALSNANAQIIIANDDFIADYKRQGYAVYEDRRLSIALDTSVPLINATSVWNITNNGIATNGTTTSVCVIDTGATHPDLNIIAQQCFCDDATPSNGIGCCPGGGEQEANATDDHGHGTHVSGIVASHRTSFLGVAPGANIVALKALNSDGDGYLSDIANAVNWCRTNAATYNITAISMSLGDENEYNDAAECTGDILATAIENAVSANIPVIIASGNEGFSNGISYPACNTQAISVGASSGAIMASFTNTDELLDVVAPGVAIESLNYLGGSVSNQGTSMAAPHVAGVIALLSQFSTNVLMQTLTANQSRLAIAQSDVFVSDSSLLFPRIDAWKALMYINNSEPNITSSFPETSLVSINEPDNQTFNVTYEDANNNIDNVTWYINGSSVGTSNEYNFTSNYTSAGAYLIRVVVADEFSNATMSWVLSVNNTNRAPTITNTSPTTNVSLNEPQSQVFSLNASDADNDTLTYNWTLNDTVVSNASNYTFSGNYSSAGNYVVRVNVSDGINSTIASWNLVVNETNRAPQVTSTITPVNAYTNNTLNCTYTYTDLDNDTQVLENITWYKNGIFNLSGTSTLASGNTTKGENWTCSASVGDGINITQSNTSITILNSAPSFFVANITVRESELVNVSILATDEDNDPLSYSSNSSLFTQDTNNFTWMTNLSSAGTYSTSFSVFDGEINVTRIAIISVEDAYDSDGDGNPDFNDTDDDNDGLLDDIDTLIGNSSSINSSTTFSFRVNDSDNLSQSFNGTHNVTFIASNITRIAFTHNFSNRLNLYNVSITLSNGSISISGLEVNKSVRIEDVTSITSVCVKDATGSVSSGCNGANETLITCDGSNVENYTCTDEGSYYLVSGVVHSTVTELCADVDADGYSAVTCGGNDCDDASSAINPGASDTCGDSIDQDCSGSDAICEGSSGGGGGGGGGAAVLYNEESEEDIVEQEESEPQEVVANEPVLQVTNETITLPQEQDEPQNITTQKLPKETVNGLAIPLTIFALAVIGVIIMIRKRS